jgi:hypothetical protein
VCADVVEEIVTLAAGVAETLFDVLEAAVGCISGKPAGADEPSLGVVMFCWEVWFEVTSADNEFI